ncbi:DUF3429 domain-containing protein [Shewanella sp. Choline-02u-19]|jgi:drug/metabolite transporter (DMT)-like permease|uniref:DUF3429 domain-containing protein n=1 Tax=unclassified Shewanella TaxID=196818 RepID=UPI000C34712F|nr:MULTISPECIES: DUF3429 domain-containing protein [unclassified Shewanella]PKG74631.1 DUF3429 domain-containing protein [Shewanella sp. GutCb]PKH56030.1 DUF3429 domain-containing protein [Shewanella sp. Bg11-22]PKI30619.1 DUF3429 domain-containing protein [Shewanella sp. Choline-02u-19]
MFSAEDESAMGKNERVWLGLGYAGLLPFILSTLMVWLGWQLPWFSAHFAFISYSAIILSFISGTLWGRALALSTSGTIGRLLILSNLYSILAWVALLLNQEVISLAILSVGYLSLLAVEKKSQALCLNDDYLSMRHRLTLVAVSMHLLMLIHQLFGGLQ